VLGREHMSVVLCIVLCRPVYMNVGNKRVNIKCMPFINTDTLTMMMYYSGGE